MRWVVGGYGENYADTKQVTITAPNIIEAGKIALNEYGLTPTSIHSTVSIPDVGSANRAFPSEPGLVEFPTDCEHFHEEETGRDSTSIYYKCLQCGTRTREDVN